MKAKELMNPRYEVIATYPSSPDKVGDILECPMYEHSFSRDLWVELREHYPHLFRKMNWWEKRTAEQMPKRVISKADDKGCIFEIQEWDMDILVGWIDKKERSCCSLLSFKPEYGYFPID